MEGGENTQHDGPSNNVCQKFGRLLDKEKEKDTTVVDGSTDVVGLDVCMVSSGGTIQDPKNNFVKKGSIAREPTNKTSDRVEASTLRLWKMQVRREAFVGVVHETERRSGSKRKSKA